MVYRAETKDNQSLAVKFPKLQQNPANQIAAHEIAMLKKFNSSPYHVSLYATGDNGTSNGSALFMEYLAGNSYFESRTKNAGAWRSLSNERKMQFAMQLLHGVQVMHKQNIVHKDLKPENIGMTTALSANTDIKIIDLGSACSAGTCSDTSGYTSTYAPPQMFNKSFGRAGAADQKKHDVFSAGLIIYEFFSTNVDSGQKQDGNHYVTRGRHQTSLMKNDSIPTFVQSLLKSMLQPDVEKRCTIDQAIQKAAQIMNKQGFREKKPHNKPGPASLKNGRVGGSLTMKYFY